VAAERSGGARRCGIVDRRIVWPAVTRTDNSHNHFARVRPHRNKQDRALLLAKYAMIVSIAYGRGMGNALVVHERIVRNLHGGVFRDRRRLRQIETRSRRTYRRWRATRKRRRASSMLRRSHVVTCSCCVNLALRAGLRTSRYAHWPNYTWITPNLRSPAFQQAGLLLTPSMNRASPARVRTVSPFIKPGVVTSVPYNHYSMLRTIEDLLGLAHLGYADYPGGADFGTDIFGARPERNPVEL
jgi:hypothetical protein